MNFKVKNLAECYYYFTERKKNSKKILKYKIEIFKQTINFISKHFQECYYCFYENSKKTLKHKIYFVLKIDLEECYNCFHRKEKYLDSFFFQKKKNCKYHFCLFYCYIEKN